MKIMAIGKLSASGIFNLLCKSSASNENTLFVGLLRPNPLVGTDRFNGGNRHAIIETPVHHDVHLLFYHSSQKDKQCGVSTSSGSPVPYKVKSLGNSRQFTPFFPSPSSF